MANTVKQEANDILKKAEDIIGDEMQKSRFPFLHMIEVVEKKVQTNVYDAYESPAAQPYERRRRNGGIQDTTKANEIANGIDTIGIIDNRHEVAVVESGWGYKWMNSEMARNPYPRPFYEAAEDELIADGQIENYLKQQLDAGL